MYYIHNIIGEYRMIYNKKISRIKDFLTTTINRHCDVTIPYEYAVELYKLLNNIETVKTRELTSEDMESYENMEDEIKKHLADSMADFLYEQNCIKFRKYQDKYGPNKVYDGELLIIKPMESDNELALE